MSNFLSNLIRSYFEPVVNIELKVIFDEESSERNEAKCPNLINAKKLNLITYNK